MRKPFQLNSAAGQVQLVTDGYIESKVEIERYNSKIGKYEELGNEENWKI